MHAVSLEHWLAVSAALFSIGAAGVVARRNAIVVFMAIELMLSAAVLALVAFSRWTLLPDGQAIALFAYAVMAGEAAVGLALVVFLYRAKGSASLDCASDLKG